MPFHLRPSAAGKEHFLAKTGSKVTITLKSPPGTKAEILHIQYAGDPLDDEGPFEFAVKAGPKRLSLLVEASKPGVLLQVREVGGPARTQVIDSFFFDPGNPGVGYIVRGTAA